MSDRYRNRHPMLESGIVGVCGGAALAGLAFLPQPFGIVAEKKN